MAELALWGDIDMGMNESIIVNIWPEYQYRSTIRTYSGVCEGGDKPSRQGHPCD